MGGGTEGMGQHKTTPGGIDRDNQPRLLQDDDTGREGLERRLEKLVGVPKRYLCALSLADFFCEGMSVSASCGADLGCLGKIGQGGQQDRGHEAHEYHCEGERRELISQDGPDGWPNPHPPGEPGQGMATSWRRVSLYCGVV